MSDLLETVRTGGLIASGRPVVVLYSGGRDSTCLLDVAVRIAGASAVRALHVEYGLRDMAVADARHCEAVCAELGVELIVRRPRHRAEDGNVQAWARRERYAAAAELAAGGAAAAGRAGGGGPTGEVATGHTATDQAETILYRLASSPSRRALLGMRARTPATADRPAVVRPLLGLTREQTTAHCRVRGLAYREDETNESGKYARGRIRTELLPALERAHPAAVANLAALAEVLAAEAEVLDELVDAALADQEPGTVSVATLRAQPPALRRLIVQRLADEAAGGPAAGVARRAEEVAALPLRGTASLHLPHGVRASVRAGVVRFDRTPPVPRGTGGVGEAPSSRAPT
ncbi:MAG TPA: tRNA lysidine(34) synthetase TilS [Solirubrobacteraceae bacterium]|nr:tRNA lysidine(34) synthetase TilS [Solirubrobacteraceae bacterium]